MLVPFSNSNFIVSVSILSLISTYQTLISNHYWSILINIDQYRSGYLYFSLFPISSFCFLSLISSCQTLISSHYWSILINTDQYWSISIRIFVLFSISNFIGSVFKPHFNAPNFDQQSLLINIQYRSGYLYFSLFPISSVWFPSLISTYQTLISSHYWSISIRIFVLFSISNFIGSVSKPHFIVPYFDQQSLLINIDQGICTFLFFQFHRIGFQASFQRTKLWSAVTIDQYWSILINIDQDISRTRNFLLPLEQLDKWNKEVIYTKIFSMYYIFISLRDVNILLGTWK